MTNFFTKFYDYFEEKWLSIPFEFRIVILVSTVLVLLMLTLYLYFFNRSILQKIFFCSRFCRRQKKKRERPRSKTMKGSPAANKDEAWTDNPDAERYGERQEGHKGSLKSKKPLPRHDSYKVLPTISASVSEIRSEVDGTNSFMNQDFNQQVKEKQKDNLMENLHKYKQKLDTNIQLVRQSSGAKEQPTPPLEPPVSPKSDYRSEYNLIKIVDQSPENDPAAKEEPKDKSFGPRKIELSPTTKPPADSSVYSGFSQHMQESIHEPDPKKLTEEEKKHSAFSSFN